MSAPPSPSRNVGTVVVRVTGVLVLLTVVGIVLAPRMPVWSYRPLLLALGLAVLVGGYWLLGPVVVRRTARLTPRGWDAVAVGVSAVGAVLAGLVAWGCAYTTTWDVASVRRLADLSASQYTPGDVGYLQRYPHNFGLIAVGRLAFASGWGYEAFFAVLNVLVLVVAAVATYLTVRLVRGPGWGVAALVALWLLLGSTPWLAVPYTDTLVLASPVLSVLLYVLARRRTGVPRVLLLAGSAAVLGLVYALKPTVVVGIVALVLVLLHEAWEHRMGVGRAAAGVVAVLLVTAVTIPLAESAAHTGARLPASVDPDKAAPTMVFIAMGSLTQRADKGGATYWYGGFDPDLEHATYGRRQGVQNRLARAAISQEWDRRGLVGTMRFWVDKTLATWGDGMFFDRSEGTDLLQPQLRDDAVSRVVGTWNVPTGALHGTRVLLAQIAWIGLLLALGIGLLRGPPRPETVLMALTVLGIAAFVVLFLSRPRHLLPYVPVIVALVAVTLPPCGSGLTRPRGRPRPSE